MSGADFVTAFAPASIGNVAVGFDMLGLAVEGVGDRVSVRRVDAAGVRVLEVRDWAGHRHPGLTTETLRNTASIAAGALWRAAGVEGGLEVIVRKGIPLKSGMGSSAASAVAAAVAANSLLDTPLDLPAVLTAALEGEKFASGGGVHADNVAPSLLGGLVLCPPVLLPDAWRLDVPAGLSSVLLHPDLEVDTAESRRNLRPDCTMEQWLAQQGYLAGFITACAQNDRDLIRRSLKDVIIEPQRRASVPCFDAVKEAAMQAGALGCSLSGSGPAMFALCSDPDARNVALAMERACEAHGTTSESWISPMNAPGARLEVPE
jgi:homoserine kinase